MKITKVTSITTPASSRWETPKLNKVAIRKMALDGIKVSKESLLDTDGQDAATCSGSYDLGYYEGMLRCLELLNKK